MTHNYFGFMLIQVFHLQKNKKKFGNKKISVYLQCNRVQSFTNLLTNIRQITAIFYLPYIAIFIFCKYGFFFIFLINIQMIRFNYLIFLINKNALNAGI